MGQRRVDEHARHEAGLKLKNERSRSNAQGRKATAPVLVVPGHPDGAITVHLGFGRARRAAWAGCRLRCLPASHGWTRLFAARRDARRSGRRLRLCVTKVHNIEHRGAFAQQDLRAAVRHARHLLAAGHEAMERRSSATPRSKRRRRTRTSRRGRRHAGDKVG